MLIEDIKICSNWETIYPGRNQTTGARPFKGRPEISLEKVDEDVLASLCPTVPSAKHQ
jgi:hypothetical protein